jgi:diamine N-acetyltransferase
LKILNRKADSSVNLLHGARILLRAVEPSDIDLLLSWENDTSIWLVSNTMMPYSRYEIEEYVLNARRDIFAARQLRLMIDLTESGKSVRTIGTIDLFEFDPVNLRAGIGIMIETTSRNRGFATEAIGILSRYARETLRLHQLYCNISAENKKSITLFTKLGFVRCGTKKEWLNAATGWLDEYMYQLIL